MMIVVVKLKNKKLILFVKRISSSHASTKDLHNIIEFEFGFILKPSVKL
jgi:hypothetical protein